MNNFKKLRDTMINDIKNLNEVKYEKLDGILAIFMTIYINYYNYICIYNFQVRMA